MAPRPQRSSSRKNRQAGAGRSGPRGAKVGYDGDIGHEVTGVDPAAESESDLELGGLYVDDIPRESTALPSAPGGKRPKKKRKKPARAAERRREREPELAKEPEGPETTTALPPPEPSLDASLMGTMTGTSGKLQYAAGVLQCVRGPEEGLALNLIEGTYTIGRARENNFVLKDIAASRVHLKIVVDDNQVRAVDQGSGNGTKINGSKIKEVVLKNGDRLEIGNSVLVFTFLGRDRSTSLPAIKKAAQPPIERPPTQERIVAAAEKLAAELSERFRREDDDDGLDELPATSMSRSRSISVSAPRVPAPDDSFVQQDSFSGDDDMAAAIQAMARDISNPSNPTAGDLIEAIGAEPWADGETATRLPMGDEMAQMRGYGGALPPPPPQTSGPSRSAPARSAPSRSAPSAPAEVHGVVAAAPQPKGSGKVLTLLLGLFVFFLVGGGGFAGYLYFSGSLKTIVDGQSAPAGDSARYSALLVEAEKAAAAGDHKAAVELYRQALVIDGSDATVLGRANASRAEAKLEPWERAPTEEGGEAASGSDKAGPRTDKGRDGAAASSGDTTASAARPEGGATDKPAGGSAPASATASSSSSAAAPAGASKDPPAGRAGQEDARTSEPDKGARTARTESGSSASSPGADKPRAASSSRSPASNPPAKAEKDPDPPRKETRVASARAADPKPAKKETKPPPKRTAREPAKRTAPPKRAADPPRREEGSSGDSDDERAKGLMRKAVNAIKKGDTKRACDFIAKVESSTPADSIWNKKAKALGSRYCE